MAGTHASPEIDIEKLLNDPKIAIPEFNIPEFNIPDIAGQDEINQVLMTALAEIDENQQAVDHPVVAKLEPGIGSKRPLSPESLISPDESVNSPEDGETLMNQIHHGTYELTTLDNHTIELVEKNEQLLKQVEELKKTCEIKTKALSKSLDELKKSEVKRIKLMEENRVLKKTVCKYTLNSPK